MAYVAVMSGVVLAATLTAELPRTQPANIGSEAGRGLTNAFFVMDTATRGDNRKDFEAQVKMVKDLGYAGWTISNVDDFREMVKAADAGGVKLFAVYVQASVDDDAPPYDPRLKDILAALKGRQTIVWIYLRSNKFKPSSDAADGRAVATLEEIAGMAEQAGLRVALYPHFAFHVERVEHALRLVQRVRHRNVGITFNLCHWLRTEPEGDLDAVLRQAMPYLYLVTINGADRGAASWDRLIRVLGRGDFDVYAVLKTLRRLGYEGPIGFQGYGIKGDIRENLDATMKAWRQYVDRMATESRGR